MIIAADLLSYSKELYKNAGSDEVALRNVARNSYYALFHELASIELESIPVTERSFGSHEQLIQQLRASTEEKHRKLGLLLASLKSVRTKADYKLDRHFSEHDARSTMLKVDRVFQELSQVPTQDDTDSIVEANNVEPERSAPCERPILTVIK